MKQYETPVMELIPIDGEVLVFRSTEVEENDQNQDAGGMAEWL